jgi:NitT/TauT family transport system substrate-binding protein
MQTRLAVMTVLLLAALAPAGMAVAQTPRSKLVIGMPVTPPNLPHLGVYVAKDLGYFEEEGINLDLAAFESGLQALRGGVAGGLDILGASSEPVLAVGGKSEASSAMPTGSPWSWWLRRASEGPPICAGRTSASRRLAHSVR